MIHVAVEFLVNIFKPDVFTYICLIISSILSFGAILSAISKIKMTRRYWRDGPVERILGVPAFENDSPKLRRMKVIGVLLSPFVVSLIVVLMFWTMKIVRGTLESIAIFILANGLLYGALFGLLVTLFAWNRSNRK